LPGHAPASWEHALLAALPYAKRLELERRDPAGRRASLAGIALALACVARLRQAPASARDLRFPHDGKPVLLGGPFFSVSHTAERVACAASAASDCGLDIEALPSPAPGAPADIDRLRRWTATEAVLKSAGLGLRATKSVSLAADLHTAILHDRRYCLCELSLAPGIVAHVAAREPIGQVRIEEIPAGRDVPAP